MSWGRPATFHMLDIRQYRDDQACGDGTKECPETLDLRFYDNQRGYLNTDDNGSGQKTVNGSLTCP